MMNRRHIWLLALVSFLAGCSQSDRDSGEPQLGVINRDALESSNTASVSKPTLAVSIPRPNAPSKLFGEHDLSVLDSGNLAGNALQYSNDGDYSDAVQLQYWSVMNSEESTGQYNLACFYSLAGDVESSLFWLQEAAEKQGVDAGWAGTDSDLANVRADSRWSQVMNFLQRYNDYWQVSDHHETSLIVLTGYMFGQPIPLVIGLHGMGSRAKSFVDEEFQTWADEMNVAFVGVSGTIPRGPTSFVWSEDPSKDLKRVLNAINEVSDRVTPKDGALVLFGFSQGAMMAAEIAARQPNLFCGALVMSAGGEGWPMVAEVSTDAKHQRQGYVVVCGAQEARGNVVMAKLYADQLSNLKSRVIHKPYAGVSDHSFPPDFNEMFRKWIRFIQDPSARKKQ